MTTPITSFSGEHRFLSNFWPAAVRYEGITYPSTEHAYQAAKTLDPTWRRRIADLATAGAAKTAGRVLALRPDWERVKLGVMEAVLRQKFADAALGAYLRATAPRLLVEGNTWGDRFWGVCGGVGQNHLGRLLMRVRGDQPRVVNVRDNIPGAVLVDRTTPYGNPFVLGRDGTRDEVCDKFAAWFPTQLPLVIQARRELVGRDLACHCVPLRCHAATVLWWANNDRLPPLGRTS